MEGVVQAGKWRGYHVLYLIKLPGAAQRKAVAVCAACKPKITHIVHNIKTKFLRGDAILGTFMNRKAKLPKIRVLVSYILDDVLHS